jgi:hypothetical protein
MCYGDDRGRNINGGDIGRRDLENSTHQVNRSSIFEAKITCCHLSAMYLVQIQLDLFAV